jgi:hypothetical protein
MSRQLIFNGRRLFFVYFELVSAILIVCLAALPFTVEVALSFPKQKHFLKINNKTLFVLFPT